MLDKKYNHKISEKKWQEYWTKNETYKFQDDKEKSETFVIDTPPPTVSGLLHMGHVFSYTQADFIARFQRMNGKDVFYPMGFDDNGLPTERLVEKVKKIRANQMDREDFIKECESVVEEAEEEFEKLFNSIALSVDWKEKYQTISKKSQQLSQSSFVDLYKKGLVERKFEPVIWDCVDQTALSQADLVDQEMPSSMNFIEFEIANFKENSTKNYALKAKNPEITSKEFIDLEKNRDNVHAYPEILHDEEGNNSNEEKLDKYGKKLENQRDQVRAYPKIHETESGEKQECVDLASIELEKNRDNVHAYPEILHDDSEPQEEKLDKYGKILEKKRDQIRSYPKLTEAEQKEQEQKLQDPEAINIEKYHRDDVHAYPNLRNPIEDLSKIEIMTTRPELLGACVAVMINANHEDESGNKKWSHLITKKLDENQEGFTGSYATTPLFGTKVPIFADNDVKTDKGTGAVMCCTFGDETDIKWFKKHNLDLRITLEKYGKIANFDSLKQFELKNTNSQKFQEIHEKIQGKKIKIAKEIIIENLKEQNLLKASQDFSHIVKCAERSGSPIEIIVEPQWFIKILDKKEELITQVEKCAWHPEFMKVRALQWIENLSWDWCISRQRYFGVPFPVWYVENTNSNETQTITADFQDLPINPLKELPNSLGYEIISKPSKENNFFIAKKDGQEFKITPETDILDTWATSSISPQLSSGLVSKEMAEKLEESGKITKAERQKMQARHQKLFPADLRPQAHEIIRTWAFYTITKALLHEQEIPWKNLMISGWCLAADKTKMSKSKGNVVTPTSLVEEKGSDVVRYWTSTSNLGADTAYSEDVFKIGQKLTTKLYNATKFAAMNFAALENLSESEKSADKITQTADLWVLSKLHQTIKTATANFEKFEYAKAREAIEDFFWNDLCDNYLEIIKVRSYGLEAQKLEGKTLSEQEKQEIKAKQLSSILTLEITLNTILKLFAPFTPHICEELYSKIFTAEFEKTKSINARGNWPKAEKIFFNEKAKEIGDETLKIIAQVRKFKSDNNLSMKTELQAIKISSKIDLESIKEDLANVCGAKEVVFENSENLVEIIA